MSNSSMGSLVELSILTTVLGAQRQGAPESLKYAAEQLTMLFDSSSDVSPDEMADLLAEYNVKPLKLWGYQALAVKHESDGTSYSDSPLVPATIESESPNSEMLDEQRG
jgi:hypothetical protein